MSEPARSESMEQRSLRAIAERTGWPAGALDACFELETAFPGWTLWWAPENIAKGFECPTGFHASFEGGHRSLNRRLFAETIEELRVQLEELG
jgi:hypothetical protein